MIFIHYRPMNILVAVLVSVLVLVEVAGSSSAQAEESMSDSIDVNHVDTNDAGVHSANDFNQEPDQSAVDANIHRLRSAKIRASQKVLEPSESDSTITSAALSSLIAKGAAICPAVKCDCGAIKSTSWQQRCLAAELKVKQHCAANQGVPKQYCTLHGPDATPIAITVARPAVPATTAKTLRLHQRQASVLMWSIKDDLDNVRGREQEQSFGDALQVLKLLDRNIERLYLTQYRAAEGERQRVSDNAAEAIWREYREELGDLVVAFHGYAKVLWSKMHTVKEPAKQKAYRILAMRVGRSASTLSEQYAQAYAGEGNAEGAAKAWQHSALIASDLMAKEQATSNSRKRVAYYRYQSAARWNRASFYWMETTKTDQLTHSIQTAELLLTGY
ncbi:hypothetical protein [Marinagarivorans algicola]|uniref:hypothetical protein n=1 Tax=Marinagarivorans algicola TaxID=1513270 RepID=UPI003735FDC1